MHVAELLTKCLATGENGYVCGLRNIDLNVSTYMYLNYECM